MAISVIVAVLVVGTGTAFERVLGNRPLEPSAVPVAAESSGAWFCPHGGGDGWRAWVVAANPGDREADVTLTTLTRGKPQTEQDAVPPHTERYFEVPSEGMASATLLEYFGPPVVAGMVTERPDGEGLAAEPCADDAGRRWLVPEGTSVRGQSAHLVVVNPFAEEAVIDVLLVTEGETIRHGNLQGVVVEPYRAAAFELNRFALGEETLTADVRVGLGRVAVAGLGVGTDQGLRSLLGVTVPATSWVMPAAGDADPTRVTVEAASSSDVPFQVLTQGSEGSKVVLEEESVRGRSAETLEVPHEGDGVVVAGTGSTPFVAGRRLAPPAPESPQEEPQRRKGKGKGGKEQRAAPPPRDLAATAGLPEGSRTSMVVSPLPHEGGASRLVLENAGAGRAVGRISLLGEDGPVGDPIDFTLEPGHTMSSALTEEGGQPLTAIVRLSSGTVAPAQVATVDGGYAVSRGIPVEGDMAIGAVGI
jgi:hypothetical protein